VKKHITINKNKIVIKEEMHEDMNISCDIEIVKILWYRTGKTIIKRRKQLPTQKKKRFKYLFGSHFRSVCCG